MIRVFSALLALTCMTTLLTSTALAGSATSVLSGTVIDTSAHPVPGAQVTAAGASGTFRSVSDAGGRFQFPPLPLGTYAVTASHDDLSGRVNVDLTLGGNSITIALGNLKEIGSVRVHATNTLRGSGGDVVLNSTSLTLMPYYNAPNAFAQMMLTLPGAAQGANGVVHMNGDHGVISYNIDGVPLPQALNRDIGGEIPLSDLSFVNLVEGAYPAQYGLRFGSVFNLQTRSGIGPAGTDAAVSYGSYGTVNSSLAYHAPIGNGGGFNVALSGVMTDRGLDPPDFNSPHNSASSTSQFFRFTLPGQSNDYTNITFLHSISTFQIPNDIQFGEPGDTDDNENQEDTFAAIQAYHAIGDSGLWSYGAAFKSSNIVDFGDPYNDWIYGESLNQTPPPFGNGGSPSDCANALKTGVYVSAPPPTCAFSLNDNRTAFDYILQTDLTRNYGHHTFQTGATYDATHVVKEYNISLQPNNYLQPVLYPNQDPTLPTTVTDDSPNNGNTYSVYAQDSWRMSPGWEADYGLRYDFFNIRSTSEGTSTATIPTSGSFDDGFGGVSPRLKLTWFPAKNASLYAYIGRFFEPFSFENVSPEAAYLLNLPLQRTVASFDLKPERDTFLELGGHVPVGGGDLGFRIWQKNATDLIDDTQVGVTNLHQDINYQLGRISAETLNYTQPLARGGRAYFAVVHGISVNSGCETQLLAPCFGSPSGYTPADHEQIWTINGGYLTVDRRGGWFSVSGYYGSGLASDFCDPDSILCHQTPHTTFDAEKGIAIGQHLALYAGITNLLNDRYYVTVLNAQGNHYGAPRLFTFGFRFKQ
jgi:outer membrane receptor for ferrienterochelin and colicins